MIPDMPRPRYPHIHQETHRGVRYWYFRRGKGPRIRLRGEFGSPEFLATYEAALAGATLPERGKPLERVGTLGWLIGRYQDSGAWARLSEATRRQRANILQKVSKAAGGIPLDRITKAKIVEGRDARATTPGAANNFLKTMSALFKWAIEAQLVKDDPTSGVAKLGMNAEGFHTWTEQEIARFEAHWLIGTRERLAMAILLYTGLRRGDAARLGRQHVQNGVIRLRTEKTGTELFIPVLPALQAAIDATKTGDLAFIAQANGRPMTKESFGNWFREACKAAGVPGAAHGLRKAGATRAAENGATERELMAIFGWTDGKMATAYTRTASTARLAMAAVGKLAGNEKATSIPERPVLLGKRQ